MKRFTEFFRLLSPAAPAPEPAEPEVIEIDSHRMPVVYRRHARARKYVLRLNRNKTVQVTIPRHGTRKFARAFVASRQSWLEKQWRILELRQISPAELRPGMEILLNGRREVLEVTTGPGGGSELRFGAERTPLPAAASNLRPALERHLQGMARTILKQRTEELARAHGEMVGRVVIRNQKSRWGSCSCQGTISLNWRLIQLPPEVRDYIIIHELMHLRHLNHSPRFWAEVAKTCPGYRAAEEWLKQNSGQVGF